MPYNIIILNEAKSFIGNLPREDRLKITSQIKTLSYGDFESVHTKVLRSPIRELIIKKFRITFFIHKESIYFTGGFVKKTAKTPMYEIDSAEKIYKYFISI